MTPPQTATLTSRLHILQEVYQQEYHSEMADRVLDKLIALERDKARRELAELRAVLQSFEQRHQMPSKLFVERFQRGELGDEADFFEWSATCGMCQAVEDRLAKLSAPAAQ
jgi:hypothetical protein